MDGQCNGPSTANKISPENDASQQPPLTQQGNLFTSSEVKKDLPVKQLDKMSMMDQLTQELGKKKAVSAQTASQKLLHCFNNFYLFESFS